MLAGVKGSCVGRSWLRARLKKDLPLLDSAEASDSLESRRDDGFADLFFWASTMLKYPRYVEGILNWLLADGVD